MSDRQPEECTNKRAETHACDLISRQAAIDAIADYLRRVCLAFSDYMTDDESKECATCILQLVPSAQPERERGEWYKPKEYTRDSYRYICSNCQDVAYYVTGNNGKKQKEDKPKCGYRYCPNCGADMRGDRMNDLISRQAAIDEAKEWIDAVYFEENDKRERKAIECFIGSLKNMPSAQPERKKGWWIVCTESFEETFHTGQRCSACNYWKPMGIWNYCPNCGAYMGGDT